MNNVQRWKIANDYKGNRMEVSEKGKYVKYADYLLISKELEQLRADAERYRYLRDEGGYGIDEPCIYADDDCNTWLRGEEADKAIDTARKSS